MYKLIYYSFLYNLLLIFARKSGTSNTIQSKVNYSLSTAASDLLYSLLPMMSAAVSIGSGRDIGSGVFSKIICNLTGLIFNVTIRQAVLSILGSLRNYHIHPHHVMNIPPCYNHFNENDENNV